MYSNQLKVFLKLRLKEQKEQNQINRASSQEQAGLMTQLAYWIFFDLK